MIAKVNHFDALEQSQNLKNMRNRIDLADIQEALENCRKWFKVYEVLLKKCRTKSEAKEALLFIIEMDHE